MPLDPQILTVMEAVAALGLPPNHEVSPEQRESTAKCVPGRPAPTLPR